MPTPVTRENAHVELINRVRAHATQTLGMELMMAHGSARQHQKGKELYLAKPGQKRALGLLPSTVGQKIFAVYAWDHATDYLPCFLEEDTTGLLEAVKKILHKFHLETGVRVCMSFCPKGRTEIIFVYPQKPTTLPPPPPEIHRPEVQRIEDERISMMPTQPMRRPKPPT